MEISKLNIIRLSPSHQILPFDCDDTDLNDFLLNEAKLYLAKLLAVTYLFEYEGITVAFFSVSNDKISITEFESKRGFKRLFQEILPEGKRYKSYPAVKIGRLGVHKEHQNGGFGSKLLDYIKGMFIHNNRTGCQYITVDAYRQSLRFYEKNSFKYFTAADKDLDTRQMYCSLVDLVN
jgi:GNAT superfamily N-acetyltransferase